MADKPSPAERPTPRAAENGRHDVVVIGASAGGVEALVQVVRDLPHDLEAAVLVVLHVMATGTSVLPELLDRASALPARAASEGEEIEHRNIYVAPPDHHLVVQEGHVELSRGPRENGHRPAVDVMFRSAAWAYGPRVVGVILSGARDDGTAGLRQVKSLGGVAIVQDPKEAVYPSMPRSAAANVNVDWIAPLAGIAPLLTRLAREGHPVTAIGAFTPDSATPDAVDPVAPGNDASGFTCPDCGGAMWQAREGNLVRLQCRVGHSFSPESLLGAQANGLESALWAALRTLEERSELLRRIAARSRARDEDSAVSRRFEIQADDADARATLIRRAIMRGAPTPATSATAQAAEVKDEASTA